MNDNRRLARLGKTQPAETEGLLGVVVGGTSALFPWSAPLESFQVGNALLGLVCDQTGCYGESGTGLPVWESPMVPHSSEHRASDVGAGVTCK